MIYKRVALILTFHLLLGCQLYETAFIKQVRENGVSPVTLIVEALDTHPIVFIGDSHSAAEPKEILIQSIEAFEKHSGVDFVVLEVSSSQQRYIDMYLASSPEKTSLLIDNPATLREHWGISVDYLNIYQSIWKINQSRQADRKIKIIAADHSNWPPPKDTSLKEIADIMSERDVQMLSSIEKNILNAHPKAKTLVFMGTFHGAKKGSMSIGFDVNVFATVNPVAGRIDRKYPNHIYTVMVDGMPEPEEYSDTLTSYGFTRYFDLLFSAQPTISKPIAVSTGAGFDFVSAPIYIYEDLYWNEKPIFREQFDAYTYLGQARPITVIE